jgi:hypothetical protein
MVAKMEARPAPLFCKLAVATYKIARAANQNARCSNPISK